MGKVERMLLRIFGNEKINARTGPGAFFFYGIPEKMQLEKRISAHRRAGLIAPPGVLRDFAKRHPDAVACARRHDREDLRNEIAVIDAELAAGAVSAALFRRRL